MTDDAIECKHGWAKAEWLGDVKRPPCPHCIEDEKILAEKAEALAWRIAPDVPSPDPGHIHLVESRAEQRAALVAALLDFAREVRR